MGQPDVQRLEHALKGLSIGLVSDIRDAAARAQQDGLTERVEQFQIAISGRAEEFFKWSTTDIKFGTVFVDATGQRDSPFDRPHFTYGAVIDSPIPVGVLACVLSWKVNDRNETLGCKLAIGVAASDVSTRFKGGLHASFEGYGQPLNTFMAEDVGEG